MVTAKKRRAPKKAVEAFGASGPTIKLVSGKAAAAKEWSPADSLSVRAAAVPEAMDARPKSTSRYPISNQAFDALKAAAPKARLAKKSATVAKDSKIKVEVAHRGLGPTALTPGLAPGSSPTASTNFDGIAATGWLPPDCTLAVGPAHVLVSVNSSLAVHSNAGGAAIFRRTLTQWFANIVNGMAIFDPKALYDQHAGRWVLLAVATRGDTQESVFLLSISATSDPAGAWRNYKLDATLDGSKKTTNWADFPALGVDSNALYVTANMFAFGGGFQYAKVRAIPKTGPYAGGTAPYFDFTRLKNADNTAVFTLQPCHTFGAPQVQYLVNSGFPSGNYLSVWRTLHAATAPTITRSAVKISPNSLAPNAEQKGGGPPLNTGDVRVLHAVFRGDSIWTAFTTAHTWGAGPNRAAVQWCQVRAATPALVQEGIFGASGYHYFYPAACPDNNGNMMLVMSRSGPSEFASILYSGRRATPDAAIAAMKEGKSEVLCEQGQLYKVSKNKDGIVKKERLTKLWTDWVDYWAVDFDYLQRKKIIKVPVGSGLGGIASLPGIEPPHGELALPQFEERWTGGYIFENEWQSFRTRQNRDLELTTAVHTYDRPGRYTVAVKVIDIFGNDTMTLVPVNVG